MSLLGALLWITGTVFYHVALWAVTPSNPNWLRPDITDGFAIASAFLSVGLFFYARRAHANPMFILNLGLVYMVLTGVALGLVTHWQPVPAEFPIMPQISWTGAVILMFAAIVPNAPSKTLISSLLAVSMNPLAMLLARARGTWEFGPATNAFVMHYPDFMLVGVAVVISQVVTKLGHQVTKAREMGSYELVSLLGQGGMGEVWLARHRMLARDAAIKLIHPGMLNGGTGKKANLMVHRFEQEAKATASLRSPHTVELYDFGVAEDGAFYYVMELLDGIDLETLVTKYGPQPPARTVRILRQVCRSLAEAHTRGLIHRDIKPANIFLCRMGNEHDFAKVLDFGLVKVVDRNAAQMTNAGATTGTPAYMAPEIALGESVDGRTDLYGLGCVGYWLLTGGLVFEEKTATAMMMAHATKVPIPPSQRSELEVPVSLDRAILMCLAKKPDERPANAGVLERTLEGSAGLDSWTQEDAERWWLDNIPEHAVHGGAGTKSVAAKGLLTTL